MSMELLMKTRELLFGSGFLTRRNMTQTVKSDVKPHSFLSPLRVPIQK